MSHIFVTLFTIFFSFRSLSCNLSNESSDKVSLSDKTQRELDQWDPYIQIVIETTSRPSHQIVSNIILELLTTKLRYQNVTIKLRQVGDDREDLRGILRSFSPRKPHRYPEAMVNMEVWQPPGFRTDASPYKSHVIDAGPLGPIISPGFFIPQGVVLKFWNSFNLTIDHWRFFRQKIYASHFHLPISGRSYDTVMCSSKSNCAQLLFSEDKEHFLSPVIKYINATRLLMTPRVIKSSTILDKILNISSVKRPLLFGWYPNPITLKHKLIRVVTSCDDPRSSSSLCRRLQIQHVHKWVWQNLSEYAPNAYALIKNVNFSQKDYEDLLRKVDQVNDLSGSTYRQIAREWIGNNSHIWKNWLPKNVTELTIAGLFPTSGVRKLTTIVPVTEAIVSIINKEFLKISPFRLKLEVYNVSTDDVGSVLHAFNEITFKCDTSRRLVGIIASTSSDVTIPIAELSNHYEKPIFSPTVETLNRKDSKENFRYFFRTMPDHSDYALYIRSLFKMFEWKRFGLFHQDALALSKQDFDDMEVVVDLEKEESKLTVKEINKNLDLARAERVHIFVVDYRENGTTLILCSAAKKKMMAPQGYVWFLGSWVYGLISNQVIKANIKGHGCSDTEVNDIMSTLFFLSPHKDNPVLTYKFRQVMISVARKVPYFNRAYRHIYFFTIDAIMSYVEALKKLIPNGTSDVDRYLNGDKQKKLFLNLLSSTNFEGISGKVTFTDKNIRPTNPWTLYQIQRTDKDANKTDGINRKYLMYGRYTWNKSESSNSVGKPIKRMGPEDDANTPSWHNMFSEFPNQMKPSDGSIVECAWPTFHVLENKSCDFRRNWTVGIIVVSVVVGLILLITIILCSIRWYIRKVNARYPQPFAELQEALAEYEIPRSTLHLQYPLGQGAFGTVYYGEMKSKTGVWTGVAAKVLRDGASSQERREFLCEAIKMREFKHKNVMTIIGVVTTEPTYVNVMEFMLLGDLRKYLLTRHHLAKNTPDTTDIHPSTLTIMALDIARGLDYLQHNRLVHRDLACRNCLVDKEYRIKISDFGMTREIDDRKTYYRFEHPGILPVRWMAPESIQSGLFNFYTDIWSYGVVLYEIVTFGNQPYRGRTNEEVIDSLKRYSDSLVSYLVKPEERIPELFELMRMCWSFRPEERPTLSLLIRRLEVNPECVRPCLDESPPDPGEARPRGQGLDRCASMFTGGDNPVGRGNRGLGGGGAGAGAGTGSTSFARMISSGSRSSCDRTRFASGNRVDTDLRHCDSVGRVNNLTSNSFTTSIASRLGFLRDNPNSKWYAGGSSSKPYRHTCSQEFLSYSRHHSGDQEISTVSDPHGYQVEYDPLMLNAVRVMAVNAASNAGYSGVPSNSNRDMERGSSSGGQRDDDDLDTDQQTLLNTGRA